MPVVEDPVRANGRLLLDGAGVPVARFEVAERDDRPRAERVAPADGVSAARAVAAVMAELRGWRAAAEEPFGRLLVEAGARPLRRAHVMSRDLVRDPAPRDWLEPALPDGVRLAPVDRPATELLPALIAAFPRDHPDYGDIRDHGSPGEELEDLMSGRRLGPLLRCSSLAVGESGDVVGAILVNGSPGDPPLEGPWIANVFRRPDARGVGGALLKRALGAATRDALPAVGLAVTHANPARRFYAEYDFVDVLDSLSVEIP
jgi:hypothetical protein